MKLASHNWMRPEPLEKTLDRLHRCGYHAIEISGEPYKYKVPETKALLAKYQIECWGAVTLMLEDRDLVRHDEQIRKASIQYCKDCITMIHGLGGKILTIVPATVGRIVSKADPKDEWKWAVEALREINRFAREYKVQIGIEPLNRFETNFINNHKQALLLAQEVGGGCGVCLDGFHINIEEQDPLAAIKAVGDKLMDFHVADTNRRPPGQGHHDWDAIVAAIRSTGYDGCLTNEVVVPFDRTPVSLSAVDKATEAGAGAEEIKFIIDHGSGVMTDAEYEKNVRATADYMRKYITDGKGKSKGKVGGAKRAKAKARR
jgi:sugar phosphate isomerase/epimerase